MSKKKRKGPRAVPAHPFLYVGRVIRDNELGTGMVTLVVYRDQDQIHLADGDEFVTFQTRVPLFGERGGA